jgi:hypothetical protein
MTLARSCQLLATGAAVCLGGSLFFGSGGLPMLAQAGESSLEFVGNLINNIHNISLDRFDPTCPSCF